jgi:transcription elongation factor Elf1
MDTTTKNAIGFKTLICPFCGSNEATMTLNLSDLDFVTCSECSEEFTAERAVAKATETLSTWQRVARMVEYGRELAAE